MKAISLWQPWATLVALGEKKIETRAWRTTHRGTLAIHATQKMTREMKLLCETEPFASSLDRVFAAGDELPLGAIVAVCELVDCAQIVRAYRPLLENTFAVRANGNVIIPTDSERAFGDWIDGRFAWILKDTRRLDYPVPCRGAQGLFDVPRDVLARIEAQL